MLPRIIDSGAKLLHWSEMNLIAPSLWYIPVVAIAIPQSDGVLMALPVGVMR
jgi:hypothetical protein